MTPEITIAILTYRRRAHLERALASARAQQGVDAEIIVVDNAAEPGLEAWLGETAPTVRYIAMEHNGGCEGRNAALRAARAPLVITLDDDVEFVGTGEARRVIEIFRSDSRIACANFLVTGADGRVLQREWCHPRPITHAQLSFDTYFILEGACALRRDAALAAGGYYGPFFLGHEGIDLAYRLLDRGGRVIHTPRVTVVHYAAAENRPSWRLYYYYTRNGIWVSMRNFRLGRALYGAVVNTARMAFFAARAGELRAWASGLGEGARAIRGLPRAPMEATTLRKIREMRTHRVSFAGRVRRHLKERVL